MRSHNFTVIVKCAVFLFTASLVSFAGVSPSGAVTKAELLPQIFNALGHEVPARYFSDAQGDLTKSQALRASLEAMGWGFEISMYEQMTLFPEWSDRDPINDITVKMSPPAPSSFQGTHLAEPLTSADIVPLKTWLIACRKQVSLKASFIGSTGTELSIIRHGIGNPNGPANGTKNGANQPVYAAVLCVDISKIKCQIVTAAMMGSKKATLASMAQEYYGAIGGVNGGYFAGAKAIGVLRRQGYNESAKFWPRRSAFGWNSQGDTVFIDGKQVANIAADKSLDKYTEMMQAGPLLLKDGVAVNNTENVQPGVLYSRHPRTIVGTDGKRVMWAVIDGRQKMHSVGATIAEARNVCKWLGMKTALNLDGGGSSSLWWRGTTVTKPSNSGAAERPIPYAVLLFQEGTEGID
jgi:exopolysaccharide biosynthesis protein